MKIPISLDKRVYFGTPVSKELEVDDAGKATELNVLSVKRVHMRAFHLSWLSFFTAFTGWFALTALMPSIKSDTGITDAQASTSDITNVSSTVIFRFFVGPLVDYFGARKVMAIILGLGSIPLMLSGLVSSAAGLVATRFFVGLLGATFVPCQYWTSAMFSSNVVGSANALAAGWGNMGAGVTYLLMPQFFNMFRALNVSPNLAWRVTVLIPGCLCVIVAMLCLKFGDDKPVKPLPDMEKQPNKDDASSLTANFDSEPAVIATPDTESLGAAFIRSMKTLLTFATNPYVLILALQYACCFGVELSVDSKLGGYLSKHFIRADCDPATDPSACQYLSQSQAGLLGSTFGLLNLFSRATGGLMSDYAASKTSHPIIGRMAVQLTLLLLNGIFLISFSFLDKIEPAMVVLVAFSFFTEAACGSSFALVPFVSPSKMGTVSGLVGAGGNIGGALFNVVFGANLATPSRGFLIMGSVVVVSSLATFGLKIQGVRGWRELVRRK